MDFVMSKFEIKNFGENEWERVSKKFFLSKLKNTFEVISPILLEMFQGKEIVGNDCFYRIQDTLDI
jgi:hypothetical protein